MRICAFETSYYRVSLINHTIRRTTIWRVFHYLSLFWSLSFFKIIRSRTIKYHLKNHLSKKNLHLIGGTWKEVVQLSSCWQVCKISFNVVISIEDHLRRLISSEYNFRTHWHAKTHWQTNSRGVRPKRFFNVYFYESLLKENYPNKVLLKDILPKKKTFEDPFICMKL